MIMGVADCAECGLVVISPVLPERVKWSEENMNWKAGQDCRCRAAAAADEGINGGVHTAVTSGFQS